MKAVVSSLICFSFEISQEEKMFIYEAPELTDERNVVE